MRVCSQPYDSSLCLFLSCFNMTMPLCGISQPRFPSLVCEMTGCTEPQLNHIQHLWDKLERWLWARPYRPTSALDQQCPVGAPYHTFQMSKLLALPPGDLPSKLPKCFHWNMRHTSKILHNTFQHHLGLLVLHFMSPVGLLLSYKQHPQALA